MVFSYGNIVKMPERISDMRDYEYNNRIEGNAKGEVFPDGAFASDVSSFNILPGFTDVHVHFREPGFLFKETMKTGSLAAAAGGFTDVCTMPNLKPVPDSMENLKVQLDAIERDAAVNVYPFGSITKGEFGKELADLEEIAPYVIGFTDDGRGVMSDELMLEAMRISKDLGKIITAHCEDERFPRDSREAEYIQLDRDLNLVAKTGVSYHMCHASCAKSIELIREAKKSGLDVTCETAPHYLILSDQDFKMEPRFRMNPPIKGPEDRDALIEACLDGTIDMLATDHAPHAAEDKEKGAYGIVGLETAFPVLYGSGMFDLDTLVRLMHDNPNQRFGIRSSNNTFSVWDLTEEYVVEPEEFQTMGRFTPFEGMKVKGRCHMTVIDGKTVWKRG